IQSIGLQVSTGLASGNNGLWLIAPDTRSHSQFHSLEIGYYKPKHKYSLSGFSIYGGFYTGESYVYGWDERSFPTFSESVNYDRISILTSKYWSINRMSNLQLSSRLGNVKYWGAERTSYNGPLKQISSETVTFNPESNFYTLDFGFKFSQRIVRGFVFNFGYSHFFILTSEKRTKPDFNTPDTNGSMYLGLSLYIFDHPFSIRVNN